MIIVGRVMFLPLILVGYEMLQVAQRSYGKVQAGRCSNRSSVLKLVIQFPELGVDWLSTSLST
jgi:hypothetical protein